VADFPNRTNANEDKEGFFVTLDVVHEIVKPSVGHVSIEHDTESPIDSLDTDHRVGSDTSFSTNADSVNNITAWSHPMPFRLLAENWNQLL
jgi:hypothetical protein